MTHRIGSKRIMRAGLLVASTFLANIALANHLTPAFSDLTDEPAVASPAEDREGLCRLLKVLGKPCPPEEPGDFTPYEDYYAEIEQAWMSCNPNGFDPQKQQELLAAALVVKDSQTPAPAGVDPTAHQNFIFVLDEIIYEMGG